MGTLTPAPQTQESPRLAVPWYRSYQFRTLLFILLILAPTIFALHAYIYFSSYTGLVQSLVRRTELLMETLLFGFDNMVGVQANLLAREAQSPLLLKNLSLLPEVQGDPLRYDAIRTHLIAEFLDDLGIQRQQDMPLWMRDVVVVDERGRIWVSTQKRHEGRILSPQLMEALRRVQEEDRPYVFLWGSEIPLGYHWAWMGIVQSVTDPNGNLWWVLGLIPPESLSSWLESLFAVRGSPFVITENHQAFGVSKEGERTFITPEEIYETVVNLPPQISSWSAMTWFMWRGTPVHLKFEESPEMPTATYIREDHPHLVIFDPENQGRLWVVLPGFLGGDAQIGVIFSLPETLGVLTRPIGRYIQLQAVFFLALMMVAGWWFSRRVSQPVREVTESVRAFTAGLWHVRVPVRGQDEFAVLAQVFNHMAATLERLYRSLEEEVQRRTYQVRLFLDWLSEKPPANAQDFRDFLQRVLEGLRPFLPGSVHPVLVLWNEERSAIDWRAEPSTEEESRPAVAAEHQWVQEVLRQRRAALYTQETHRGQIPEPYKAVWVHPLFHQDRPLGVLLFYSTQDQTFDDLFQNQVQDLAPTVSSAVVFARFAWVRLQLHHLIKTTLRLIQSVATAADLMGIFLATARLLERDFPNSILLIRVPETEDQWQPLYPATLAGRTIKALLPISREQRWLLEPDLEALRAVQRLPRELRELAQEQNWKGVVVLPVWTQRRLEAVLLLGMEEPGEYPEETLDALAMIMHILAQMLERTDVQEHVRLWQTVMEFFLVSTEAPTLGHALAALVRSLRTLFTEEGDYFFAFVDEEGHVQQSFVFLEGQEQYHFVLAPAEQALVHKVVEERQPLLFSERREMVAALGETSDLGQSAFPQSWVGLPFVVGGRVLGVWGLRDAQQAHRFDRTLVYRLTILSERLAPAMHYLMRMQQYEQRLQREEWIHALGTHLVSLWDPSVLTQETAGELMRIFQARRVAFRLHMPAISEATAMRLREALREDTPPGEES